LFKKLWTATNKYILQPLKFGILSSGIILLAVLITTLIIIFIGFAVLGIILAVTNYFWIIFILITLTGIWILGYTQMLRLENKDADQETYTIVAFFKTFIKEFKK